MTKRSFSGQNITRKSHFSKPLKRIGRQEKVTKSKLVIFGNIKNRSKEPILIAGNIANIYNNSYLAAPSPTLGH